MPVDVSQQCAHASPRSITSSRLSTCPGNICFRARPVRFSGPLLGWMRSCRHCGFSFELVSHDGVCTFVFVNRTVRQVAAPRCSAENRPDAGPRHGRPHSSAMHFSPPPGIVRTWRRLMRTDLLDRRVRRRCRAWSRLFLLLLAAKRREEISWGLPPASAHCQSGGGCRGSRAPPMRRDALLIKKPAPFYIFVAASPSRATKPAWWTCRRGAPHWNPGGVGSIRPVSGSLPAQCRRRRASRKPLVGGHVAVHVY